jgi:hypothetical protein
MQRTDTILLITSTIAPAPDTFALKVIDPVSRLAEYCTALRFYLNLLDRGLVDHIVYADNSGHPLTELQAIVDQRGHAARVEFLSFGSTADSRYGRYFLEMNLIDTAFGLSKILSTKTDQVIWKVTGRYVVQNIARIIATAPRGFDLYVNCRNRPMRFLDFYLVAFRSRTYPQLLGREIEAYRATGLSGEIILRNRIDDGTFGGMKIVPRFRTPPRLTAGRRGYDGAEYSGAKESLKYLARSLANRLLPWLWI